jgi:hypothetical protein
MHASPPPNSQVPLIRKILGESCVSDILKRLSRALSGPASAKLPIARVRVTTSTSPPSRGVKDSSLLLLFLAAAAQESSPSISPSTRVHLVLYKSGNPIRALPSPGRHLQRTTPLILILILILTPTPTPIKHLAIPDRPDCIAASCSSAAPHPVCTAPIDLSASLKYSCSYSTES